MATSSANEYYGHSKQTSCVRFVRGPASSLSTERFRRRNLSRVLERTLDRVNVLGGDSDAAYGHTGCVNALSWARDGELLLSGGDDTTVRVWRIDPTNTSQEYPFVCRSVVQTGHRANIFSAQMLPCSSRIATVAGDKQVRVFDVGEAHSAGSDGQEVVYSTRQSCTHILRCHEQRVKRIITEHSPDLFLSVAEDGTVRQHDLRAPHDCRSGGACPVPLVKVNHELSTMSLSPLTPYQFVVAGESPYGYLFDRRQAGRILQEEWGMVPRAGELELTTCVRRFGRLKGVAHKRGEHITGARMSAHNGHEVLLSYSGDAVYLYSTADDPGVEDSLLSSPSSVRTQNSKRKKLDESGAIKFVPMHEENDMDVDEQPAPGMTDQMILNADDDQGHDSEDDHDTASEGYPEFVGSSDVDEESFLPHVPVILPRRRFAGARNVATIKDVNFLGPDDECVTSGSDDGNFFIWDKATAALREIYEGDSSVVNVVEGHPHLPLVAVSGIDSTVKLFAPTHGSSQFSRMDNAERIIETNRRSSITRILRYNIGTLLADARLANEIDVPQCRNQ